MATFAVLWLESIWMMLIDSAFFFLVGLALAGLVWLFLNEKNLSRLVGKNSSGAVVRAALIGVPLPLCSCSVLPVASQLRQSGLSKGGTVSFLVSTPESGVDSILLTYSLTDPLLTVARPITAFLTAMTAGFVENAFGSGEETMTPMPVAAACGGDCCCDSAETNTYDSLFSKIWSGLKHAFTTLIGDLAPYLLVGYVLAGLVAALLGPRLDAIPESLTSGWLAYVGAIVLGLPLYICATSSTPLAAVLLAAGFPPGAIMVFLMVGPATNMAALAVLKRILGIPATIRYLVVIAAVSIVCGLAVDWLYDALGINPLYRNVGHEHSGSLFNIVCAVSLSALMFWHSFKRWFGRLA